MTLFSSTLCPCKARFTSIMLGVLAANQAPKKAYLRFGSQNWGTLLNSGTTPAHDKALDYIHGQINLQYFCWCKKGELSFLVFLSFAFCSSFFFFPLLLYISKPKNCPPIEVCGKKNIKKLYIYIYML